MRRTYIREWREFRGLSLRQLANRVADIGDALSHASINRIENGTQPYNQMTLEAIADALDVPASALLTGPPEAPEVHVAHLFDTLPPAQKTEALQFLRFLAKKALD